MMDGVGVYRTGRAQGRRGQGPGAQGALRATARVQDEGTRLQHGPAGDARAGLPARLRGGRGGRRAGAHREPRRARPRGLPRRDDERWLKHTLAYRDRGGPGAALQAGDHHDLPAQAPRLLGDDLRCRSGCASCATTPSGTRSRIGRSTRSSPSRPRRCWTCCTP